MLPVILITGHGDIPMAVQAMKDGAFDFLQKPFRDQDLLDRINAALKQDAENRQSVDRLADLRQRAESLTPREREVMGHVVDGKANKVIAIDLGLSERTVEIHRANVMEKMGARSVAHLVKMHLTLGGEADSRLSCSLTRFRSAQVARHPEQVLRRIVAHGEFEPPGQGDHRLVIRQYLARQPMNALLSCIANELPAQQAGDTTTLPCVCHTDAELSGAGLVRFRVASDANELLDFALLRRGDERHPLPIVDVHELVDQMPGQDLERREQAKVSRSRGKRVDECDFTLPIVGTQRPDAERRASAASSAWVTQRSRALTSIAAAIPVSVPVADHGAARPVAVP